MPSEKFERKGLCKAPLTGSVWKQGHSIKCERRGASTIRYWQPSKNRYLFSKYQDYADIYAEIRDFCIGCRFRDTPYEEAES